ncbi:MAG: DNA translocase FtsK 4TM domain-containing protein, partial [Thermoanaerobaculia bacterium]
MSEGSFWRSRLAGEALGILLFLAGALTALALVSYDPKDPNLFSLTRGGEAAAPSNWIGGFGASLATGLYAAIGLAALGVPVVLVLGGWRRFWQRPLAYPGSKAAGLGILFLSAPALLTLTLGRRTLFGEEAVEVGGALGKGIGAAAHGSLGATGAILLMATLVLLAVPLSTQVSLADVALALRMRFAGLYSRLTVGWARRRDRRTKERLRRTVVSRHLERARKEGITLDEVPFARDDGPPILREVPGQGKFSITKTTVAARASAPAAPVETAAFPAPALRKKADPQKSLPLTIEGYTYPPVSLLERRENAETVARKARAETGRTIAAKCLEFGVEGEIAEYHPGPVV